ncbi:MAG: histidine kinase [Chitinophagaceae bacterium]|nr:histidine kinase [Chitinophagaceae bacterium]
MGTYRKVFIHLLFWLIYSVVNAYLWYTFDKAYIDQSFYGITRLPIKVLAVYGNAYLLERFFFQKKYFYYFLSASIILFLSGLTQTIISDFHVFDFERLTIYSLPIYSVVIVSTIIIVILQYFKKAGETHQLQLEQVRSELNYLKTQVQPHFLFNTLNNIYSLTLENSKQAGKSILQLSELLRYMLYETSAEKIKLSKEVNYLQQYINLEKIRFGEKLELSFNTPEKTEHFMIPPLILIPFVENAFKHAVSVPGEKIWITIDIVIKDAMLFFTVENSTYNNLKSANAASGIGLENLKRRLSLLYVDFEIVHEQRDNYYHSSLQIPL